MKAKIVSFPRMSVNALTDVLQAHGCEVLHMDRTHVPTRATVSPGPYVLIRDYQFLPLNQDVPVLKEFTVVGWEGKHTFYPGDVIRLWYAGNPSSPAVWTVERAAVQAGLLGNVE